MYKHVFLAFLAASVAPTKVQADEDSVIIVYPPYITNFNAYEIKCDSPLKPNRQHLVALYNLSTSMDGSSLLEEFLEDYSNPNIWVEYDPSTLGFQGAFVVAADGERFFVKDNHAAATLLERFRSGELDPSGIPIERSRDFEASVPAMCGFGT